MNIKGCVQNFQRGHLGNTLRDGAGQLVANQDPVVREVRFRILVPFVRGFIQHHKTGKIANILWDGTF